MTDRAKLMAGIVEDMVRMRRLVAGSRACLRGAPTRAQVGILMILGHDGPQGLKDLAGRLCVTPSAATQLVNGLVEEGMIARTEDPADHRKIRLALTATGKRRLERARSQRLKEFTAALEPLTDAELRTWRRLQQKILTSNSRP